MFHSLVFSQSLIKLFVGSPQDYNIDPSKGDLFIGFPHILAWIKNHYSCNTLIGMPLENSGSKGTVGSHWEKTAIQNDIMTGVAQIGDTVWSGLNNALLQDSGWYEINNTSLFDNTEWGKNKGCSFIQEYCRSVNNFPEFCTQEEQEGIDFTYSGLGQCTNRDNLMNNCKYILLYSNTECMNSQNTKYYESFVQQANCVLGPQSKAFQSSIVPFTAQSIISQVLCYQYSCNNNNSQINIQFGNQTLQCSQNNQIVNAPKGFKGVLQCPQNILQFCQNKRWCKNFCYSNGYCINGVCKCIQGAQGEFCQCDRGTFYSEEKGCSKCNTQNCQYCDSRDECLQCHDGYGLNNKQCVKCNDSKCLVCKEYDNCTKCMEDTSLKNGVCFGKMLQIMSFVSFILFIQVFI
ncbi:leishmanolysin family protein, putative [Ichthyophthirius multifiliis]|uniref:Leishmanolysin family protein, putative n=1 Tax=Ichthyophthirius multifiliis TaxID=5932 RepID=G0QRB9_ICHMU|nr:leishmanolysin family protein, putative [Ichthyophthirius multifiliis]EGR32238.1 leishmanolysin family protein, putative [Ichthyophthirius multifiliis]|eukprot:XP_004035724.1 leishmanolysin family protein, putative [Ichthyophthirius multifiliis]